METIFEMRKTKKASEADILKMPGITGMDIGYKYVRGKKTDELAIRVFVEEKKDVPKKERIPKKIDGIKTDVIQRKFVLHPLRLRAVDIEVKTDAGRYDPLKGGISIGPCRVIDGYVFVGTLGAIAKDNATGHEMLLSNFHVMCIDDKWKVGDKMAQPSLVDGGVCPADVVGELQRASLGGKVDCAVAEHTTHGFECEIVDVGKVTGTAAADVGMAVRKRGRTTRLTYGKVDTIDLTVKIDYEDGLGIKILTNQIGIEPDSERNTMFGDNGDSGSVVVNDDCKVVGLYFAGSEDGYGVANPIQAVLDALNVSICAPVKTGITGKVVDKLTGKPVEGAKIYTDTGQSAMTGSDGTYELGDVPTGDHVVTAIITGCKCACAFVTVKEGEVAAANFELCDSQPPQITADYAKITGKFDQEPPAEELTDQPIPLEVAKAKAAKVAARVATRAAALRKGKTVLIINGDNDIHYEDDQSVLTFMSAFQNMGDEVRVEQAKDTSYSTWSSYDIVVWSCGDDYSAINDIKNKQMLIEYVAQGGRLILEGGNIAGWIRETGVTIVDRKLREKVLHATTNWVYHDVGDLVLKTEHPIATTPNKLPETIGFTPTEPDDDSGDANAVRILPDATCIYGWSYVAYEGKLVNDSVASKSYGLIAYESENGGRIVYYAFDIDDIDSPDIQQKLIQNSGNWLKLELRGIITGKVVDKLTGKPVEGATICTDTGQSTKTGSVGTYELIDVPTGDRGVTAIKTGCKCACAFVTVKEGEVATAKTLELSCPHGEVTIVPNVVSKILAESEDILKDAKLVVGEVTRKIPPEIPPDTVLEQNPASGTEVPVDSHVDLIIATDGGGSIDKVPNVFGMTLAEAKEVLKKANLRLTTWHRRTSTKTLCTVLDQEPRAGTEVSKVLSMRLWVAVPEDDMYVRC